MIKNETARITPAVIAREELTFPYLGVIFVLPHAYEGALAQSY